MQHSHPCLGSSQAFHYSLYEARKNVRFFCHSNIKHWRTRCTLIYPKQQYFILVSSVCVNDITCGPPLVSLMVQHWNTPVRKMSTLHKGNNLFFHPTKLVSTFHGVPTCEEGTLLRFMPITYHFPPTPVSPHGSPLALATVPQFMFLSSPTN